MREIYFVWFIAILGVSAKYCDEKKSPSNESIAILKEYCDMNNGDLTDRACFRGNKTLGCVLYLILEKVIIICH